MKVRIKVPFVGYDGTRKYRLAVGEVIELPAAADWLRAGLVEEVIDVAEEPVTTAPVEKKPRKAKG